MSWRDFVRPASFRGIAFSVFDTTTEEGRRNVVHQFAFKDDVFVEDLGLDASEFTINAFIIQTPGNGLNYFPQRDSLREALKKSGSGTLIHPFLGTLIVSVRGKYSLEESFGEGGMARFTINFVEAGSVDTVFGDTQKVSPIQRVDRTISDGIAASKKNFILNFKPQAPSIPGLVSTTTNGTLVPNTQGVSFFSTLAGKLKKLQNLPDSTVTSLVSDISSYFTSSRLAINTIVNFPASIISEALELTSSFEITVSTLIDFPSDLSNVITGGADNFTGLLGLLEEDFKLTDPTDATNPELTSTQVNSIDNANNSISVSKENFKNTFTEINKTDDGISGKFVDEDNVPVPDDPSVKYNPVANQPKKMFDSVVTNLLELTRFGEEVDTPTTTSIFGGRLVPIAKTTPVTTQHSVNQEAFVNLARNALLFGVCRLAVRNIYDSVQGTENILSSVVEKIDAQLLELGNQIEDATVTQNGVTLDNSDFMDSLEDLRNSFLISMREIGKSLPEKVDFTVPPDVLSTLELAYDKYLDLNRAEEVQEGNLNITHPAFLPSREVIEVLNV